MAEPLYKIVFVNRDKVYEVYARQVHESGLYGFIEIEELVFGEHTTVVIDPAEEKLKSEFSGVKRTYIPLHAIVRIDEVEKRGTAKIVALNGKAEDIYNFGNIGTLDKPAPQSNQD
ncbi:MAG: DUF1820 family protein [Granulosicoccaceae bacterium]